MPVIRSRLGDLAWLSSLGIRSTSERTPGGRTQGLDPDSEPMGMAAPGSSTMPAWGFVRSDGVPGW